MVRIRWKAFLLWLGVVAVVYLLSGLASMNAQELYARLRLPAFAPPTAVYPFVWAALYLLMAISAYLVHVSESPALHSGAARTDTRRMGETHPRAYALALFCAQLIVNGIWPLLFFRAEWFFLSFVWLLVLWLLLIWMLVAFRRIRPVAAWLQVPYFLWTSFAAVLNGAIWLLNR